MPAMSTRNKASAAKPAAWLSIKVAATIEHVVMPRSFSALRLRADCASARCGWERSSGSAAWPG